MWNNCRKPANGITFSSPTNLVKSILKKCLLQLQSSHGAEEWCKLNFGLEELSF